MSGDSERITGYSSLTDKVRFADDTAGIYLPRTVHLTTRCASPNSYLPRATHRPRSERRCCSMRRESQEMPPESCGTFQRELIKSPALLAAGNSEGRQPGAPVKRATGLQVLRGVP